MELNVNLMTKTGISDQALVTRSRSTVKSATRDLEFLTDFGVTAEFLAEWNPKIDALENQIDYREQLTSLKELTQLRDQQVKKVKNEVVKFNSRLEFIFPKGTDQFETIIKRKISNIKPEEIHELAGNVLFILNQPNEMFALLGITPEKTAAFKVEVEKLKVLIVEQENAKSSFSILTDERVKLRAEVFTCYQFVCKLAKAYWTRKNKGLYKDYKMYSYKSPPTGKVSEQETATTTVNSF